MVVWCIRVKEQRSERGRDRGGRRIKKAGGAASVPFLVLFDFMNENAKGKRDLVRFGLV